MSAIPDSLVPPGYRQCAVVMQRTLLANRWASERWAPVAVIEAAGPPRQLADDGTNSQWLFPDFTVALYTDEAEGYYLNLTADLPFAFVNWELTEQGGVPHSVTVSYHEAARQLDGGAQVEGVPLPEAWRPWIAAFVERHYKPEPKKKRIRPPSFAGARRDER